MKGMRILVPTDFSKNAEAALKYAIGLAADTKSHLIVLHAYRLLQTTVTTVDQSPFSIKNQWDKDTWEKFRKLEKTVIKGSNVTYDFEVDVGFAADAIISSVESNDIDFLIIGSVGSGKLTQLLGSTTLKIIDKMKCPVLVVPPDAEYNRVSRVTFAYDKKEIKHPSSLAPLVDYVKGFDATLEILNVFTEKKASDQNLMLLENQFDGTDYHLTSTQNESVAEGILDHLKSAPTDLLVAYKRDHNLIEKVFKYSVTRKLVLHSELPLLVLHET